MTVDDTRTDEVTRVDGQHEITDLDVPALPRRDPTPPPIRTAPPQPPPRARRPSGSLDPVADLIRKASGTKGGPAVEALERAADLLAQRGEPDQAVWRLEEALRRGADGGVDPRILARVSVTLARAYEEQLGRLDRAVELLEQAHKLDPNQPRAVEAGRRIYTKIGDLRQVARLYEIEIETGPSGPRGRRAELLVELAELLARIDDAAGAAARLEAALPLVSDAARAEALRERLANLYASPAFVPAEGTPAPLARAGELFRELARARRARGEREPEIACYRRALGVNPEDHEAAAGLEAAYRAAGREDELVRLYRQAPWLPGAARRLAELALAQLRSAPPAGTPQGGSRAAAACEALLAAATQGEAVADLLRDLEGLLARAGEHARLATLHEQLLPLGDPNDPLDRAERLVVLAKHHKAAGDLVRFEAALLEALAAYPGHEEAYHALAEHLTARRDYPTLVAVAEAALAAAPPTEHAARLEELAELYDKRLGDVAGAMDAWHRRLQLGASDRADSELRRLRIKEQRWAGLVAQLERELQGAASSEARAEVLRRLGQVHRERHDLERARALFTEALELRPSDPSLYRTLGELAELEGRFDELAQLLRRQYRAAKERVEKLNLLRRLAALYEERLGDWEGVEWSCDEILTHLPSDRDALRRLEQCHEAKGEEGLDSLFRVLEAHANAAATPAEKVELYRRLALKYTAAGRLDLAADRWERLIRLDKSDAEATLALARAYETLDRPADAALAYARLLDEKSGRAPRIGEGLPEATRVDAWRRYSRILDQRLTDPARAAAAWQQLAVLRPADREALAALTALHRGKGGERALEELLARRIAVAEREELAPLVLELAQLQKARGARADARARIGALLDGLSVEELAAEAGRSILAEAVALADADGDARGAIVLLERLFFAAAAEERPAMARALAERWSAISPTSPATLLAWERVRTLAPDDPAMLLELSKRYAGAGLPEQQREIDLARLDRAESANDRAGAVELGEGLARLAEEQLRDPRAAFAMLERVLGEPTEALHDRVLQGLRGLAERASLHGDLARVLADEPGLAARVERVRLFEEKLREPKRAFEVLRESVGPEQLAALGPVTETTATLLPHLLRLGERTGDAEGVLTALRALLPYLPRATQAALFSTRAEVREKRLKDPSGALDELLRAVAFVDDEGPAAEALDEQIRRLSTATRRHEDFLALKFHRALRSPPGSDRRRAHLDQAAALAEGPMRAVWRAFRIRLTFLAHLPDPLAAPIELRDEIWRLATAAERTRASADRTPAAPGSGRSRLASLEIGAPPLAEPVPAIPASPVVQQSRERDTTIEVDVGDLVIEAEARERRDQTMELQAADLAELARPAPPPPPKIRGGARPAPPPVPPGPQARRNAPTVDWDAGWLTAAPSLDQPLVPLVEGEGAWDELAEVLRRSDQDGGRATPRARLAVAAMWEEGARRVDAAFEELRAAFLDPKAPPEVRAAVEALAKRHDADDKIVAILDEAIPSAASSNRAIELLLDAAAIRERQGRFDDAEARYRRVLGIQPDLPVALERLEAYYRSAERWDALAELLERRLNGLLERMPPGSARTARTMELAEIYERIGKRYEAIGTLEALVQREPEQAAAMVELGRLYEAQGQWGKVVESLSRRIDLLEAGDGSATQPEARRLRLRMAEIFEQRMERPERALEAYLALDRAGLPDPQVHAAVERLYTQLGRWGELADVYERRGESEQITDDERVRLLEQRIEILRDKAPDTGRLIGSLRALVALRPSDAVLGQLEAALEAQPDSVSERIQLVAERLRLAEAAAAPPADRAALLTRLGTLEAEAGRRADAVHSLEQAIELAPDAPAGHAQLARLRQGGQDWHGYAEARVREAAVVSDDAAATRALLDAARAELDHDGDKTRAAADLERAAARCPADAALLAELRALYRRIDDRERVVATLRRELELPDRTVADQADLQAEIGAVMLELGNLEQAAAAYRAANDADPGHAKAVHGLADLATRTGEWGDVEPLLRYAATRTGVSPLSAAAFFRRLAEAASARGNADEAYAALIEADRRHPGDLRTRVHLGRNRYAAHRFREAAQHLAAVAEHPDLRRLGVEAAQALYEGAIAETKIKRPERVEPLLRAALSIDPDHDLALGMMATQALERGEAKTAIDYLERQANATKDAAARPARWERVAVLCRDQLGDPKRAAAAMRAAVEAYDQLAQLGGGSRPPASVLEALLALERANGALDEAAAAADRLLTYGAAAPERARRLRDAAALEAALGRDANARERLTAAHELDPDDADTLLALTEVLAKQGEDEAVASLLTRTLAGLPPAGPAEKANRAALWQRLAEARDRLKDTRGAALALEKVLELDPSRHALRQALLERYGEDPAFEAQVATHRRALLEREPLDLPSLRALEKIEARAGNSVRKATLQALQAVAGALALGRPIPMPKAGPEPDRVQGTLTEAELASLEHPDATQLRDVFSALYEGLPQDEVEDLASLGVPADARVSPVSGDPVAELFADCARLFGNRRTALYIKNDPSLSRPLVMVRPPTAVILSPTITALPLAELRFHVGRALAYTRPEHALAVGLPRERLNALFMSAVRAFHPRHTAARSSGTHTESDDAQRLRRDLPYKVVQRLAAIFQREPDAAFSSARWRLGVEHSAHRAGLVACGDFRAAARVLRDEGDETGLRELARYALSPAYLALRERLTRG